MSYPTNWRSGSPRAGAARFPRALTLIVVVAPNRPPVRAANRNLTRVIPKRLRSYLNLVELALRLLPKEYVPMRPGAIDATGWFPVDCPAGSFGPVHYVTNWLLSCGSNATLSKASYPDGPPLGATFFPGTNPFWETSPAEAYITHPGSAAFWQVPNVQGRWRKEALETDGLLESAPLYGVPDPIWPYWAPVDAFKVPPMAPAFTPQPVPVRLTNDVPAFWVNPENAIAPRPAPLRPFIVRPYRPRRPFKSERETGKLRPSRATGNFIRWGFSGATEALDIITPVFYALPRSVWAPLVADAKRRGQRIDPFTMIDAIFKNTAKIDGPKAMIGVAVNQLIDVLAAIPGKAAKEAAQRLGTSVGTLFGQSTQKALRGTVRSPKGTEQTVYDMTVAKYGEAGHERIVVTVKKPRLPYGGRLGFQP